MTAPTPALAELQQELALQRQIADLESLLASAHRRMDTRPAKYLTRFDLLRFPRLPWSDWCARRPRTSCLDGRRL